MAFTARLPEELEREAKSYAERLGLSLNALLAVSLRDYLDGRRAAPRAVQSSVEPSGALVPVVVPSVALKPSAPVLRPPKRPRDPCPCGSGQQWRHCHGKLK
jgi:hypothetical protein